jgi:hypothetical protein
MAATAESHHLHNVNIESDDPSDANDGTEHDDGTQSKDVDNDMLPHQKQKTIGLNLSPDFRLNWESPDAFRDDFQNQYGHSL